LSEFTLRPLTISDRDWVARRIAESWSAEIVVVHETVYQPAELPGFAAESEGKVIGLLTFHIQGKACEIVTLD
jgi:N-acetylglutamate synthase-like GNAT family acetyltransferase